MVFIVPINKIEQHADTASSDMVFHVDRMRCSARYSVGARLNCHVEILYFHTMINNKALYRYYKPNLCVKFKYIQYWSRYFTGGADANARDKSANGGGSFG